ncbi:uncharacterized protein LOC130701869 [Daphnia carinata]|uniref:uncharacterized protein LOC130701869 n=1 Tax=Daphnia carinata TaxID=120202 RepID=UPI00257E8C9E|nr:uncharacterized protein LOC130701869 [Daphnia carinata]
MSIPDGGNKDAIMLLRTSKKLLEKSGLSAGHALIDCTKSNAVVHDMNVDHTDHVIVEGTSLRKLVALDQSSSFPLEMEDGRTAGRGSARQGKLKYPAMFEECVAKTLAGEDREDLISLLMSFQDVFAEGSDCLGQCTVLEHAIPTGNAAPIKQLLRRRAWQERELIKAEVDKMLRQRVIEPVQRPWSSPIVLVKKKDGKW